MTPYADVPATTTILGAADSVGRTRRGWTLGASMHVLLVKMSYWFGAR